MGDFATQSENAACQPTQYARSLNGARLLERRQVSVKASPAAPPLRRWSRNSAPTALGPYQLNANGVAGSEQVHVLARSRDQVADPEEHQLGAVAKDYTIEPCHRPVMLLNMLLASVDADLNPVFIRVLYDVETEALGTTSQASRRTS